MTAYIIFLFALIIFFAWAYVRESGENTYLRLKLNGAERGLEFWRTSYMDAIKEKPHKEQEVHESDTTKNNQGDEAGSKKIPAPIINTATVSIKTG